MNKLILTILIFKYFEAVNSWQKRVGCKRIENQKLVLKNDAILTCFMNENTEINSKNFIISSDYDENVDAIDFVRNKKIVYLPERVYEKFPELKVIEAQSCSIVEISANNFEKLIRLEQLQLQNNQIEKIPNDVFADLKSLTLLRLSKYYTILCI